ncbi:MAG: elongation factor G, partial [Pirellulales bacterium]
FTAEVERCLRVLDGAVVVFSAREGVEAQSETVWRQADRYSVPRIALINKMDREGADFESTLDEMKSRLEATPVAIQIPVGEGPPHGIDPFRGIIDLIGQKMLTFSSESKGAEVSVGPVSREETERVGMWRNQMLETLYDFSDELMELALADQPVPDGLIRKVLRDATVHGYVQPVLCGSALNYIGIQPLLDAVTDFLPSPADMPPVEGIRPVDKSNRKETAVQRKPSPEEPFCGLLFKIVADRHGDLCYVRIYSGELREGTRVLNPGKQKKENLSQLWHIQADRRERVPSVLAGDIVGVIGLHHSVTGDTLCDPKYPILLEQISFPETVISMAIEPESSAERAKLSQVLEAMKRQDPTFRARENEETGQTLISGMGELHLEVIKHRLLRDFNLKVKVHKPRVSYRESIARLVEVEGECQRQIAGQALFARVRLRMEPASDVAQPVSVALKNPGELPAEWTAAVLEVLREQGEGGGSLGFPLMGMKMTVLGMEAREGESNEVAFRTAAADAFHKGLAEAGIVLLEPIMKLEVATPNDHVGDFVADLQQRRAMIHRTDPRGPLTVIEAEAPLANLFGYSSVMRSLSQGRATSSIQPASYGPAPAEVLNTFL